MSVRRTPRPVRPNTRTPARWSFWSAVPPTPTRPHPSFQRSDVGSAERMNMRMSLIAEEFAELMGAVYGLRARAIIEAATAEAVAADEGERDVIEAAVALG